MTRRPVYYKCPACDFFHPAGLVGVCHDEDNRFAKEDLDKRYSRAKGGWEAVAVKKPNSLLLQRVTATIDLRGNELIPGCAVRAFDFCLYDMGNDEILGIDTSGDRVSYVEGKLEAIGDPEGRYTIRIENETTCHSRRTIGPAVTRPYSGSITPPVNGTPTAMGWPTFSVFRIV